VVIAGLSSARQTKKDAQMEGRPEDIGWSGFAFPVILSDEIQTGRRK